MIREVLSLGPLRANCWIFGDENTREAVVVDPGAWVRKIQRTLESHDLTVKWIVVTHGHIDQVGAVSRLQELTGAPIYMNEADYWLIEDLFTQADVFILREPDPFSIDVGLCDGDRLTMAGANFEVLHTPGHTQGSICLLMADQRQLISGDTLLFHSIGGTDLPGGNPVQLMHSIKAKLLTLDPETKVFPGHGPATTIGRELQYNPYLFNI